MSIITAINFVLTNQSLKILPPMWIQKLLLFYLFLSLGSSYEFIREPANWQTAYETCQLEGKELITPSKPAQNDRLEKSLKKMNISSVWIAAQNRGHSKVFNWATSGLSVLNPKWCYLQPDNYKGVEYCVEFVRDCWNDKNCGSKLPFFCQTPHYYVKDDLKGNCKQKKNGISMECTWQNLYKKTNK